jgi:hypothetical protein
VVPLYAATLFLSSALLFVLEPLVAKGLLPVLGGGAAVWVTAVAFFQVALLAGYVYAHVAPAWLGLRRHAFVHVGLLAAAAALFPLRAPTGWVAPPAHQALWLCARLAATVGPTFVLLAATAPLVQRWFASTDHRRARDPYFLYAASNAGSLIALIAYPILLEPLLGLARQRRLWTAAIAAAVALLGACALAAARRRPPAPSCEQPALPGSAPIAWRTRGRWLALAAVPSSLLLSVTSYVSTDLMAMPLLWVVPLALYLLTFIVAFGQRARPSERVLALVQLALLVPLALETVLGAGSAAWALIPVHTLLFLVTALLCHQQLADSRPPADRSTEFYFWVAAGGALGGLFNVFVAPVAFASLLEYPLGLLAATLLRPPASARRARLVEWAVPVALTAVMAASTLRGEGPERLLHRARSFYAAHKVMRTSPTARVLAHGRTLHGSQDLAPARRHEPTTYYHRRGPIGGVMAAWAGTPERRRVGVVGLGAGTMAAYAAPGERWTFFEIDPAVVDIARDRELFTYLADAGAAGARIDCVIGDGRLSLSALDDGSFGMLVLDAFSSDAVPAHLLTREALALYMRKLAPGGLLAFHLSNRFVDLEPVVASGAAALGLATLARYDRASDQDLRDGKSSSLWLVAARGAVDLAPLAGDNRWHPARITPTGSWTDDASDVWRALRFIR